MSPQSVPCSRGARGAGAAARRSCGRWRWRRRSARPAPPPRPLPPYLRVPLPYQLARGSAGPLVAPQHRRHRLDRLLPRERRAGWLAGRRGRGDGRSLRRHRWYGRGTRRWGGRGGGGGGRFADTDPWGDGRHARALALFSKRQQAAERGLVPRTTRAGHRPPPRTKWTRRVPHLVLIGHAASLTPY